MPVKPVPLKNINEEDKEYLKRIQLKDPPCLQYYLEDTLGYGVDVDNSLGITLKHMLILHSCTQSYLTICQKIHDIIKKSIYNEQILQQIFKGDREKYKKRKYLTFGEFLLSILANLMYILKGLNLKMDDIRNVFDSLIVPLNDRGRKPLGVASI